MKIGVLGSEWTIEYRGEKSDHLLKDRDGYTDPSANLIVIANRRPDDDIIDFDKIQRRALRHEIIHAFLFESGLGFNFEHREIGHEETIIDWIALQFPKLQKAFEEAGCL